MTTPSSAGADRIVNRSAPGASVVPVLVYDDVDSVLGWLCAAFGFTERLRMVGSDGKTGHAQLSIGSGAVIIGKAGKQYRAPRADEVNQFVVVHVDDVNAHFERAQRAGAQIVRPLMDMPFGERQYAAQDPGGHHWTFSQSIADVSPEVWGAKLADKK